MVNSCPVILYLFSDFRELKYHKSTRNMSLLDEENKFYIRLNPRIKYKRLNNTVFPSRNYEMVYIYMKTLLWYG